MAMLERPEGNIHYELCDIVPPWVEPRETILFLHGLAIDSDIWVTWLPTLADRYRIVRMDLRGFGRSFVPAEGEAWSIDALAGDVGDVLAALGTQRVHFVGESTGGTVGLNLAAHRPECLLTLTMVTAAHRGGTIGRSRALRDDVRELGMDDWSAKLMPLRFPAGRLKPGDGALVPRQATGLGASRLCRPRGHVGAGGPHGGARRHPRAHPHHRA